MQVQPAAKTDSTQAPKSVKSAVDGQAFPSSLLQAFSLIPQPPPPGPEPPFLPPRLAQGAEEAAKVLNVASQKLDSPLPKVSTSRTLAPKLDSDEFQTRLAAVPSAPQVAPKNQGEERTKPASAQTGSTKQPAQAKEPGFTQARPLPVDPDAPIVSIKPIAPQPSHAANQPAEPTVKSASTAAVADAKPAQPVQTQPAPKPAPAPLTGIAAAKLAAKAGLSSGFSGSSHSGGHRNSGKGQSNSGFAAISTATSGKPAPISAPTELSGLKGLDKTALVRQVADKLQTLAASRSKEGVTVQLAPKSLGTITLTLKGAGAALDAHLAASNEHVRQALEQSRPDLMRTMSDRGYRLSGVTVSQQGASFASGGQQPQTRQSQARHAISIPSSSSAAVPPSAARPSPASMAGVDVWI